MSPRAIAYVHKAASGTPMTSLKFAELHVSDNQLSYITNVGIPAPIGIFSFQAKDTNQLFTGDQDGHVALV